MDIRYNTIYTAKTGNNLNVQPQEINNLVQLVQHIMKTMKSINVM